MLALFSEYQFHEGDFELLSKVLKTAEIIEGSGPRMRLQVLLNETRTQVDVELHQRRIAHGLEAVNLAGLDHEDVAGAAFKSLAIDSPHTASFADELDLIVGMTMRSWPRAGLAVEQEHGDPSLSLLGADKLM